MENDETEKSGPRWIVDLLKRPEAASKDDSVDSKKITPNQPVHAPMPAARKPSEFVEKPSSPKTRSRF